MAVFNKINENAFRHKFFETFSFNPTFKLGKLLWRTSNELKIIKSLAVEKCKLNL